MQDRVLSYWERAQWSAYGLVIGLFLGMILGWIFHGLVGWIVRILIVLILLTPLIAALLFWRRVNRRDDDGRVTDVAWREVDPVGRDRRG